MANPLISKTTTPALTWEAIAGASMYQVQFSIDQRFVTIEQDQIGLATPTATATALTNAIKHFWRFRALTSATLYDDQSNPTGAGSGNALRDAAARTYLAQGFTCGSVHPLKRISLSLKKTGTPTGNMWVEIWSNSGGSPGAIMGAASANLDVSTLTGSFATKTFDFTNPIQLVTGTLYYIVMRGDFAINGASYVQSQVDAAGSYSSGAAYKADGTPTWSTNGAPDHIFLTQYNRWGAWSPVRSLFIQTAASAAFNAPTTGWVLINPDDTTDYYTLPVAPAYEIDPIHKRRSDGVTNINGDLLMETIATRDAINLNFDDAYISYENLAEILRFYNMRKAIYLVSVTDYVQDKHERIWKVEFIDYPTITPIAPGREDYFRVNLSLQESAFS